MNKFKITTVNKGGVVEEVIEYGGRTFVKPGFSGQAVGWVRERFMDTENRLIHILLITPEDWNLWYTLKFSESDLTGIGYPDIGAPLYFFIFEKRWHKPKNLPYKIIEGFYCHEYLAKRELPDFMREKDCLIP